MDLSCRIGDVDRRNAANRAITPDKKLQNYCSTSGLAVSNNGNLQPDYLCGSLCSIASVTGYSG